MIVPTLARQPYEGGSGARWPSPQTPPQRGQVRERDYIAGKGSFVRAIANFIRERGFWL